MKLDADTLLALLPAFYRERDGENGPLRALLGVIARQGALLEADIERLYDNAFIETCEDWVVPYIGDLLGHHTLESTCVYLRLQTEALREVGLPIPSPAANTARRLS